MSKEDLPRDRTLTIAELEELARKAYEKEQERRSHLSPDELKKLEEADKRLLEKWNDPFY